MPTRRRTAAFTQEELDAAHTVLFRVAGVVHSPRTPSWVFDLPGDDAPYAWAFGKVDTGPFTSWKRLQAASEAVTRLNERRLLKKLKKYNPRAEVSTMSEHALPSPKFRRAVQRMVNAALEVERNWPDGMPYPQRLAYLPSWDEFVHDLLSLDEVVTHEYPARRRASTSKRRNPPTPAHTVAARTVAHYVIKDADNHGAFYEDVVQPRLFAWAEKEAKYLLRGAEWKNPRPVSALVLRNIVREAAGAQRVSLTPQQVQMAGEMLRARFEPEAQGYVPHFVDELLYP